MQHRGGPPGFLKVLDDRTLGFADLRGNRQYISLGNVGRERPRRADPDGLSQPGAAEDLRPAARSATSRPIPHWRRSLSLPGERVHAERAILLHLEAFDWNCPQHITPRFTIAEVAAGVQSLRTRLAALEAENAALRAELDRVRNKEPHA